VNSKGLEHVSHEERLRAEAVQLREEKPQGRSYQRVQMPERMMQRRWSQALFSAAQ